METYRTEDVQQILQQAMHLYDEGHFSRAQLLEMAAEVGLSPDLVQRAEQHWLVERQRQERQKSRRDRHRQGFMAHLIPFILVNALLVVVNVTTSPRHPWSIYPLMGWGLGLAMHGMGLKYCEARHPSSDPGRGEGLFPRMGNITAQD